MGDRLKALQRIESVQKQITRLAEARLGAAQRACRELSEDKARFQTFLDADDALGVPLSKVAMKSIHSLDRRRQSAERLREFNEVALVSAKQRAKAIETAREKADLAARRTNEDRDLAEATEVWIAANRASLR